MSVSIVCLGPHVRQRSAWPMATKKSAVLMINSSYGTLRDTVQSFERVSETDDEKPISVIRSHIGFRVFFTP